MNLLKVSPSPHIRHVDTTRIIMADVIIALVPALIWGVYVFGWRALTITLLSVGSALSFERLFAVVTKRKSTCGDLSAIVTGILLAFNLPVAVPLWLPPIGAFFAIIIVKMIFGGLGKNIVNPALAARVFLFISFPGLMKAFVPAFSSPSFIRVSVDAVTSATPLAALKADGSVSTNALLDLFFGQTGGCIGEVSAALLLLGGIYLICRKTITYHIPVAFIGTVFLLTFFFSRGGSEPINAALTEILSGGLFLGAIFMATDYATSPVTSSGRLIYGVGCGLITVFIRYFGSYPEGVSFAILIMNTLVFYIDKATTPRVFGGGKK